MLHSLAIRRICAPGYDERHSATRPHLRLVPMPPDQIDRSAEFKKWLALFFIGKGRYKITEKGYAELAPKEQRQNLEFGEPVSDRKREPRLDGTRPLTRKEIREAVAKKVEEMLRDGKAEELYNRGLITRPAHLDWQSKEVRIVIIKKLLEFLGASPERLDKLREELNELILRSAKEEPINARRMQEIIYEIRSNLERLKKLSFDEFQHYGLSGLLHKYKNSPYLALVEAGYAYPIEETLKHARTGEFATDMAYAWEMNMCPITIYREKEFRIAATKWLIWRLKKEPRGITKDDFSNNALGGLICYYKNSPYLALVEAGYAYSIDEILEQDGQFATYKIYPWEMDYSPQIYNDANIRIAATKCLFWKLKKDPREITSDDFKNNGLSGLLTRKEYKDSPYLVLVEAGYAYSETEIKEQNGGFRTDKLYPWEMVSAPQGFYKKPENRIAATKWLMWKLKKEPREITAGDFNNNGLRGVSNYYKGSPYLALLEATLVTQADEVYMRERLHVKLANLLQNQSES